MIAAGATRWFDVLLVVHIVLAVTAFVVLLVLAAAAREARHGEPSPSTRRSFTGRREVAGRVVHLVPLSGLGLLALSKGAYGLGSPFVVVGVAAWAVAAASLETVAFPAQRAVAARLAGGGDLAPDAARMARAVELAAAAVAVAALVMTTAS